MKRICFLFLLIICLTSCKDIENIPKIDEYIWTMTTVQSGEDGSVIACASSETDIYKNVKELTLNCEAKNGKLEIKDSANNKSYMGTYVIEKNSPKSVIYKVVIENTEGYATCGVTTYLDESKSPIFIITINNYTLNFKPVM